MVSNRWGWWVAVLVAVGCGLVVAACVRPVWKSAPLPSSPFSDVTVAPTRPVQPVMVAAIPADTSGGDSSGKAWVTIDPAQMGPNRLLIPSLGVYAQIVPVDVVEGGLQIPGWPGQVGLDVDGAPLSASVGSTLVAGHVNMRGVPGALANVASIRPGALIFVTDAAGGRFVWSVDGLMAVEKSAFPQGLDRRDGVRRLVVVTCGGRVHDHNYEDNVIVTAHPVDI